MSFPPKASSWMQDNLSWLSDRPIRDILFMPGSHDAGMDRVTKSTSMSSADNVLTQIHSIYDQLQLGIRWLDIRPMLYNGHFYCGHASPTPVGFQGGLGMSLNDVISDVNRFTQQHRELIVLRITHVCDFDSGGELSLDQQAALMILLYSGIRYARKAPAYEDAVTRRLNQYVGTDECVIITTSASNGNGPLVSDAVYPRINRFKVDFPMETNGPKYQQDTAAAILTSKLVLGLTGLSGVLGLLYALGVGNVKPSILNRTIALQKLMFPVLPQAMMSSTGGSNRSTTAFIMDIDRICDDTMLNMCLAASRAQWYTGTKQTVGEPVIVYGGQLIENGSLRDRVGGLMTGRKIIPINNALFDGRDPWYGSQKSCCMMYCEGGTQSNGPGLFWHARFAKESESVDFAYGVSQIRWHDRVLTEKSFRDAYTALFTARACDLPFTLDIKSSDQYYLQPDPAFGVRKRLVIRYRSVGAIVDKERNIYEGRDYDLNRDIDWVRWQNWTLDKPELYAQFFDRIDWESRATFWVGNEIFCGYDPAVGTRKRLTMSIRNRPGTDREVSTMESTWMDLAGIIGAPRTRAQFGL